MIRRAVVVGFPYPSRYLASLMNEHSRRWRLSAFPSTRFGLMQALWHLRTADALISFGGPGPNSALALAAHQRRVPLIVIWAGTDVLAAAQNPFELEVTKRDASADLAVSPWLAEELRALGVPAAYEPIIAADIHPVLAPFPQRFTVLTYLPAPRRTFYGEDKVYAIARSLKATRFLVVGGGGRSPSAPPNVEFLGWIEDMASVIDASTVLLRLPEHDGQSMMVLEALARGRHVVWTHEIPGGRVAHTTEDALDLIRDLHDRHVHDKLEFNSAGREYVGKECARADVAAGLEACLERVTLRRVFGLNGRRKRVAISGFGLFCAEVAKNIEHLRPDWEAELLRPVSRVEVLTALMRLSKADVWYSIGDPFGSRWMYYWARLIGIPRVMHWVGSDIECARTDKSVRQAALHANAKHLTEIEWTAQELADLGLPSEILPLPVRHQGSGVKPLPERLTILLYVPKSRADFYGRGTYERLLRDFEGLELRVLVVGGGTISPPPSVEVINFGWRSDLREIYNDSTVLIRCTPHDGLALMVVEALSFGRHVIWSKPFPYATQAIDYTQLTSAFSELIHRHKAGSLRAQYEAAEFVRKRYATERCIGDILSTFEKASGREKIPA